VAIGSCKPNARLGEVGASPKSGLPANWNSELAYPAIAMLGREPTREVRERLSAQLADNVAEAQDLNHLLALSNSDLARTMRRDSVEYYFEGAHVVLGEPGEGPGGAFAHRLPPCVPARALLPENARET